MNRDSSGVSMLGDENATVRVACVQAAPVFLDRKGSTEKAIEYILQAGREGVDLLAFPEGFIPAHPIWYHFQPATSAKSFRMAQQLFENAVEIPSPTTDALCDAARRANVNVVMGLCEKLPETTGTMFNTQLFFARDGSLLGKRQKLVPTHGERIVHAHGHGDPVPVFGLDIGRISGLICGENSNPLAIFTLAARNTQIHVASWPNHGRTGDIHETVLIAGRALAYQAGCFVLSACGTVSDEMRDLLDVSAEDRAVLADPRNTGGSSIVNPFGKVIREPMSGTDEGLLIADIDLDDCVRRKLVQDFAGHYNRPDVFALTVNSTDGVILQTARAERTASCPAEATDSVVGERTATVSG